MGLIDTDYLSLDFLVTVVYYSALADDSWDGPQEIGNCSFFDAIRDADFSPDDVRRIFASLIVRVPEWPGAFAATGPQRGDLFEIGSVAYYVESVDDDLVRLGAWRLKCYSTNSGV